MAAAGIMGAFWLATHAYFIFEIARTTCKKRKLITEVVRDGCVNARLKRHVTFCEKTDTLEFIEKGKLMVRQVSASAAEALQA